MTRMQWLCGLGIAAALCAGAARAEPVGDFYRGKTLNLILGFPPGGGYDSNIRVLARHLGKYVPGQPTVTVSNMPGVGSMLALNHLYKSAPADGTTLAMFASSALMEPFLGDKSAAFDPLKFSWIGSMSQDVAFCGVWRAPGVPETFDDMLKTESIWGGGAASAITYQHPMVLKNVLGAKFKVVPGYAGTRDIYLAMQRGEVNGMCGLFTSSIQSQWDKEVKSGQLNLVVQMGPKKTDAFGPVPSVFDYARADDQRAILDFHFRQLLLARPLAGPPDVPADRLAALRKAFFQTLDDPEFRSDAAKMGVDVDPVSVEQITGLLTQFSKLSPEIRQKALDAMGR